MKTFLKPFVDSMIEIFKNGITWKQNSSGTVYTSKVIAPFVTLDAPAKAAVQNLMQHNGKFGCSYCKIEGESYRTEKGGTVHVYLHTAVDAPLRTHSSMLSSASNVVKDDLKQHEGVKGPTVVSSIPFFNLVSGFGEDYLHVVLKGAGSTLIRIWTSSCNKKKPFYISKQKKREINKELSNLFPPDEVTRTPRTLDNLSFWKASELM